jgi:hypothetical protein
MSIEICDKENNILFPIIKHKLKIVKQLNQNKIYRSHCAKEIRVCFSRMSNTSNSKVGILGHQSKDAAKFCLHSCPLLENLADWSQWSLVFEPEHGKLKDFIQRYGGVTTKPYEGKGT